MHRASRVLTTLLMVAATTVALTLTASPASAKPAQVKPPWARATSSTTITLDWFAAAGAKKYQVFYSTTYTGAGSLKARSKFTSGPRSELTITGLKPGTMYCFAVRAVGKGNGSRAPRHCAFTMRRNNTTSLPITRVATYNVCSNASKGCHTWSASRMDAVVKRVLATQTEVVALQEVSQGKPDFFARMERGGFTLATPQCGSEAVFYRTSLYEQKIDETAPTTCARDRSRAPQAGTAGSFHLANEADAAWARLTLRRTGHDYLFLSAHLTNGKSSSNNAMRSDETKQLLRQVATLSPTIDARRVIIAGDLNSHRNRDDTPRKALEAAGWHDTYDRSATFTHPRFNSYTGWGATPTTSNTYGDHVDHVFVQDAVGSTTWRVQHAFVSGRYATPAPSDHSPVRVTLYMP